MTFSSGWTTTPTWDCTPSPPWGIINNADALAAQILAVSDDALAAKLDAAREKMAAQIAEKEAELQEELKK